MTVNSSRTSRQPAAEFLLASLLAGALLAANSCPAAGVAGDAFARGGRDR